MADVSRFTGLANEPSHFAAQLRAVADEIEESKQELRTIVLVYETAKGNMARHVFGNALDKARLIGLLFSAAHGVSDGTLAKSLDRADTDG